MKKVAWYTGWLVAFAVVAMGAGAETYVGGVERTPLVRVGAGTPTIASGADDIYATGDIEADATLVVAGISYLGDDIQIVDDKGIGISGGPEIEFDETGTAAIELLGANVRIGNGTPGTATGLEDLYVESDLEVDGNITGGEFKSVYEDLFHIYQGTQQTHTDNTGFHLVNWDTATTDADSVFTDAADSITFNGTGLVHMTMHYEFNNILGNKHVQCILMKDGVEFMGFWSFVNGNSGKNIGPTGSLIFYNDSAANVWTIEIYQNDSTSETSHSGTDGKRKWWSGYRLPN